MPLVDWCLGDWVAIVDAVDVGFVDVLDIVLVDVDLGDLAYNSLIDMVGRTVGRMRRANWMEVSVGRVGMCLLFCCLLKTV